MPWTRKCIKPVVHLPVGPTGHIYVPDLVVQVREVESTADLVRHDLFLAAPLTYAGRELALLDLKHAWEVRWPSSDEVYALVILLRKHMNRGDLVSVRPRHVAMELRDRTMIVTCGGVYPSRGSNPGRAFSCLADLMISIMTDEQLDTLYRLSGSPQVPPAVPRMSWNIPPVDRMEVMARAGGIWRTPTAEQIGFVQSMICRTLIPHHVPSYAREVLSVREADGETVALLLLFDDSPGILSIKGKPGLPGEYSCEWDATFPIHDGRHFGFDWHQNTWVRINALAA